MTEFERESLCPVIPTLARRTASGMDLDFDEDNDMDNGWPLSCGRAS